MKKLLVISMVILTMSVFMTGGVRAGSLEPSGPPGSTMTDLGFHHQVLETVHDNVQYIVYQEPMEVWRIRDIAFVDWYLDENRWKIANNGTPGDGSDDVILDKETGLMWPRNANWANGTKTWESAVTYCRNLTIGGRKGWRLPTVEELSTLVDPSESDPALPSDHPFQNVQSADYWSSTTYESFTYGAWLVYMYDGYVGVSTMSYSTYVWPVRGGSGPILVPHTP